VPEPTRDDLQAIVERHLDTWQRPDVPALAGFHSADGVVESPMYGTRRGRIEIEEAYRAFFKSFPDARMDREAILIDPALKKENGRGACPRPSPILNCRF